MKYPVTVQAVCLSKLGEFVADEREINSDSEWEEFRDHHARYTVRLKRRHRRRPLLVNLLRRYWWTIPVLLVVFAIVAREYGFAR